VLSSRDPLADPEPLIRRVYAYVAYRVGDGPHAEDIVSDVFERALRYRESYDARKGEPLAWLVGIARNRLADHAVTAGREQVSASVDGADPASLEDDTLRRLTVARAVRSLDERDQELIALRYGADLTARQIAELLGMRPNAVEVWLHRTLAVLREALADEEVRLGRP
jgi:RNA polymerase sigma-70 factor (ECF subfamily)